jgi:hypothetical protein
MRVRDGSLTITIIPVFSLAALIVVITFVREFRGQYWSAYAQGYKQNQGCKPTG